MFEKILKKIEEANSIIVVGHIRPDGDCYGSQVALKEIIKANYKDKKVYIVGNGLPFFFKTFGRMDEITPTIAKESLVIIVDVCEHHRIDSELVKEFSNNIVVIDHHIVADPIPYEKVVDENACSTCELICNMIHECGWKITKRAAGSLYLGILTDTARFNYLDDHSRIHKICSYLVDNGADPDVINRILSLSPESKLIVQGYVLTHYQKRKEGVLYIHIKYPELKNIKATPAVGSLVVNMIGNIVGYPVWASFIENEVGSCIMEFRSNRYTVSDVAVKYGGGGHRLAAGCTIKNYTQEDIEHVLDDLVNLIEEKE